MALGAPVVASRRRADPRAGRLVGPAGATRRSGGAGRGGGGHPAPARAEERDRRARVAARPLRRRLHPRRGGRRHGGVLRPGPRLRRPMPIVAARFCNMAAASVARAAPRSRLPKPIPEDPPPKLWPRRDHMTPSRTSTSTLRRSPREAWRKLRPFLGDSTQGIVALGATAVVGGFVEAAVMVHHRAHRGGAGQRRRLGGHALRTVRLGHPDRSGSSSGWRSVCSWCAWSSTRSTRG